MRTERFTFLCTCSERKAISLLAKFHRRSQGDVVRQLIIQALEDLSNVNGSQITHHSIEIHRSKSNTKEEI